MKFTHSQRGCSKENEYNDALERVCDEEHGRAARHYLHVVNVKHVGPNATGNNSSRQVMSDEHSLLICNLIIGS